MMIGFFRSGKINSRKYLFGIAAMTTIFSLANATELTTPDCKATPKAPICKYSREAVIASQQQLIKRNIAGISKYIKLLPKMNWLFYTEKDYDPNTRKESLHWPEREQRAYCESIKQGLLAGKVELYSRSDFNSANAALPDSVKELKRAAFLGFSEIDIRLKELGNGSNYSFTTYHVGNNSVTVFFEPNEKITTIIMLNNEFGTNTAKQKFIDEPNGVDLVDHEGIAVGRLAEDLLIVEVGLFGDFTEYQEDKMEPPYMDLSNRMVGESSWKKVEPVSAVRADKEGAAESVRNTYKLMQDDGKTKIRVINVFSLGKNVPPPYYNVDRYDLIPCTWYIL